MTQAQDIATARPEHTLLARVRALLPGLVLCLAAAGASYGVSLLLPGVSPLIIAIVLGVLLANVVRLPAAASDGIDFSAKKLLRAGIVFLGLQLVLTDILDLGAPMLVVVVCIVAGGLLGTVLLGRLLRVPSGLSLLIACGQVKAVVAGSTLGGAAAVAGAAGVTDPDDEAEEDTITAVALVVIFGTLMIPLVPLLTNLLGLGSETAGMWAGGSVHEIAQVVAAGGIIGGGALTVASRQAVGELPRAVAADAPLPRRRVRHPHNVGVRVAPRVGLRHQPGALGGVPALGDLHHRLGGEDPGVGHEALVDGAELVNAQVRVRDPPAAPARPA